MSTVDTVAVDIAKNVFQLHAVDRRGRTVVRRKVNRSSFVDAVAKLGARVVMMEACGGAHHWGRRFEALGMEVKLIPAQYVKPFVKTNKNDANDAEGIWLAGSQPGMSTVAVKTLEQQDIQAIHRVRERWVKERTGLSNQVRGLLAEYGVVIRAGSGSMRKPLAGILEDGENGLTMVLRGLVAELWEGWKRADEEVHALDRQLGSISRAREDCRRLLKIPGIGPVNATLLVAQIGSAQRFANGRAFSASLGLVPRQCSSGGRQRLLGISKRGDSTVRRQLVHGARSALIRMGNKSDRLSRWACALERRHGRNCATVALANKLARVVWVLLARGETYREMPCSVPAMATPQ